VIRVERLLRLTRRLEEPAGNAAVKVEQRSSLVLVLADHAGHVGLGEAAPLPGYSRDDLDGALRSLRALRDTRFAPRATGGLERDLEAAVPSSLAGSARHAVESALVDVWARAAGVPAFALFGSEIAPRCELAALLPSDDRAFASARQALADGFRHFKLKLGARTLAEDIARLARLRHELGETVRLRADANRLPERAELQPFVPELHALALEWIEEPTRNVHAEAPLELPVALDESLLDSPDLSAARERGARYVVLKPSLLGGFSRCLSLAKSARSAGLAPSVSHQFEGVIGFQSAAVLALALGPSRPADGLGPHAGVGSLRDVAALAGGKSALAPFREAGLGVTLDQACAGAGVEVLA
jgi:o-succinylbenzoate synthase